MTEGQSSAYDEITLGTEEGDEIMVSNPFDPPIPYSDSVCWFKGFH